MKTLLRWEHPKRGLLLPDEVVPVAEESDLMIPIGQWVFEQACRQASKWQQQYLNDPPLLVSINLSAKQFKGDGISGALAQILRETDVDPSGLCLEIPENTVMEQGNSAVEILHDLKALRVKLTIGDFGVGYSSLSYLKRFPFDYLKIDRSFIEDLKQNSQDQEVVTAITSLAHALNMEVVGEGIESASQYTQLQVLACEMVQGDYFSEPLPVEAASALITKDPR
jgi:EAL domain-containing protein (putative c-di-GMP-specific phosphodiesterase class I)